MRLPSVVPARLQPLTKIDSEIRIVWNILQECILSCGIFHFYAVVFESIADNQVVYM